MTEPETETESGPSAAIIESQLAAVTTTEEKGGGEVEEEEEEEIEVEAEAEEEEEEAEDEGEQQEQEEDVPEEEAVVEEEEEEQQPLTGKEQQSAAAPAKVIAQVGETNEQQQAENVSNNNNKEGGPISKKVAKEEGGKKEDEKTRQDGHKKVEEKKIEVTKVEAKKVEPKKLEDKKISVGKVVAAPPAVAEQKQVEMRDRLEDVEAEEEEEVEEEEEEEEVEVEEEVLEEKEEEEEEEEQEEEEEEQERQLQLQQVQSKEEKMEEEEEEEEEEEDAGEEDELNERDGSPEEQLAFTRALKAFFKERRMDYKAPKFYGEELNVLKLWRAVTSLGGYDQVTAGKLWRKVGEQFQPPKTCTTLSWSFRGFYEKALLEYERYQSGVSYPAGSQPDGTISGADSQAAMSPNTPSSQVFHSKLGSRQSQERTVPSKKEKQLKNLVGTKRKETVSLVERAVKVARAKGSKGSRSLSLDEVPANKAVVPIPNKSSAITKKGSKPERKRDVSKVNNMEPMRGLKLVITDDGPPADWVKINAYRTSEGYEIYALVPGLAREEVRIQCEEGGRVVICGSPEQPNNPWGVTAFRKVVNLPSKIDAHHTSAVVTLYGQLFVRVPFAHAFQ